MWLYLCLPWDLLPAGEAEATPMLPHKDEGREWKLSYQALEGEMSFGPWSHDDRKRAVWLCAACSLHKAHQMHAHGKGYQEKFHQEQSRGCVTRDAPEVNVLHMCVPPGLRVKQRC